MIYHVNINDFAQKVEVKTFEDGLYLADSINAKKIDVYGSYELFMWLRLFKAIDDNFTFWRYDIAHYRGSDYRGVNDYDQIVSNYWLDVIEQVDEQYGSCVRSINPTYGCSFINPTNIKLEFVYDPGPGYPSLFIRCDRASAEIV